MVVCKFWQRGNCRNGDECRFEHPSARSNSRSRNPFDTFNNSNQPHQNRDRGYSPNPQSSQSWGGGSGGGSGGGGGGGGGGRGNYGGSNDPEYKLSYSEIEKDLLDHPIYLLSCYGPGKDAPVQLFGGEPREISPEEIRMRFYELRDQGQQQQAMSLEDQLWRDAEYQLQNAKRDINGAINFVKQGANQHPNRIDICNGAANVSSSTSTGGVFGQPSKPTNSTFGHPLNPSDVVFGQPSNPSASAFGQPSAPSQSAFGQPSAPAFGQPSKPAFGQPSQPASSFGQPPQSGAAFGQPSHPANPFNQPAQQSNAFGSQPSQPAFGQPSKPANPFNQPATQTTSSPFGQPSQPVQPAFGQTSQSGSSPFGQQSQNTMSPFGQANNPNSGAFGQPSQPSSGSANPFAPVNGTSTTNQAQQQPQQQQASTTFGSSGETVKDANGRLRLFNGRQVTYKKDEKDGQVKPYQRLPNGKLQMIWFPDGKTFQKPAEEPPGEYTPEIEAGYKKAMQVGHFEDGAIPLLPPKREWLSFNM